MILEQPCSYLGKYWGARGGYGEKRAMLDDDDDDEMDTEGTEECVGEI